MSRKGENIYKRKDGRWEGRYIKGYSNGKAEYGYIYSKTYTEVKKLLNTKKAEFEQKPVLSIQKSEIQYAYILKLWLQNEKLLVKESTYSCYCQIVDNRLIPDLGTYVLNELSSIMIEKYINELLINGRKDSNGGLSPKTVKDVLSVIKSSIDYANIIGFNVNCNLTRINIRTTKVKNEVLYPDEEIVLVKALINNMDLTKVGILVSLYTGIRIGELCALKWKNIDLVNGVVTIDSTMQRIKNYDHKGATKTKIVITEPKTASSNRVIPLPNFLIDYLHNFESHSHHYLLTGSSEFIEPRTMQYRFKRIIEDNNIRDINYHALRHTFATRCVEANFELKTLSEILGHANVNITLNRYVHSSLDLKISNMQKINFPV